MYREPTQVTSNPPATKFFSHTRRCSATTKAIQYEIVLIRCRSDNSITQRLWLLRGVIYALFGLCMNHVDAPHITTWFITAHYPNLLAGLRIDYRNALSPNLLCLQLRALVFTFDSNLIESVNFSLGIPVDQIVMTIEDVASSWQLIRVIPNHLIE